MKNVNKKVCIWLLIAFSILMYILFDYFSDNINGIKVFTLISKVVTVDSAMILLFTNYLWKLNVFQGWLIIVPNLSGTWEGTIYSTWLDPLTGKRPDGIPVILTINQTLFDASCVMRTGEMTSHSFLCDFIIDKENQVKRLVCVYDSVPMQTVRDRSAQHFGTIIFEITKDNTQLRGEYWTGRKTTGYIRLKFWTKEKKDTLPEILGEHPISFIRNYKG